MRHIQPIIVVALLVFSLFPMMAQKQISDDDRIRINQRMRELKHNYLVNTLSLSREQQKEFFPIYDRMDDELNALNNQNRDIENSIMQNENPTDADYSTAARTLFEQKGKESEIELEYYPQFEKILSPKQLFLLELQKSRAR